MEGMAGFFILSPLYVAIHTSRKGSNAVESHHRPQHPKWDAIIAKTKVAGAGA